MSSLHYDYSILIKRQLLKIETPEHIKKNIKSSYTLRPYQCEAFARFIYYCSNDSKIKELFLSEIHNRHKIEIQLPNKEFKVIGLPLFNEIQTKEKFIKEIQNIIK